ncbi:MAG: FkbM family methyltransferase [Phycisphaerales bacterium]
MSFNESPEVKAFKSASTDRALWRLTQRGHTANTIIDVGASNGMWSAVTEQYLPDAEYLLIEAQECHREALDAYCQSRPKAQYTLSAAGAKPGDFIYFDDGSPFGGLASETETEYTKVKVPVTSIDAEVEKLDLPGPYLVKLDTHGFEVPILEGAKETLKNASILVIEVYNFKITPDSLLFWEMCVYLDKLGFSPADLSEPLWRTRDQAFWQMDLIFIPKSSPEFEYIHYA